jgi:hypothetical protein
MNKRNSFALVGSLDRSMTIDMVRRLQSITGQPVGCDTFIGRTFFYTEALARTDYVSCLKAWLVVVGEFQREPDWADRCTDLVWSWLTPDGTLASVNPRISTTVMSVDQYLWDGSQPCLLVDCCDFAADVGVRGELQGWL